MVACIQAQTHTHYFIFMLFYIMHGGKIIFQPCNEKKLKSTVLLHLVSHISKILVGLWNAFYSQASAVFPSDGVGCFIVK